MHELQIILSVYIFLHYLETSLYFQYLDKLIFDICDNSILILEDDLP